MKKTAKTLILLISLATLTIAGFLFWQKPNVAVATWWNDQWSYRQAIPVTNNASAETDVYIEITLDTDTASTSMQADCGDFRFTKENGELLPHYLVSGCRTDTNVIHANFSIFEAGTQSIYFYYGNASAENGFSASDFATEASDYTIGAVQSVEVGPGPVGYWSFDEGYGTTAHDESGQGSDGTLYSGVSWKNESECVSGKCLYFDGENGTRVRADAQDNMNEFTACTWFKANSFTNSDSDATVNILNKSWGLYFNNSGLLTFEVATDGSYAVVNSTENISVNKWYYVCGVFNGVGADDVLYINGADKGDVQFGGSGNQDDDSSYQLSIGCRDANEYFGNFNGYIDEVKIYPYARTADQIRQDYLAGSAGVSADSGVSASFGGTSDKWMSDGLVGYWKFDESATTSGAIDSSGNGNTGTFYGDASTTAGKFGNSGEFDASGDYIVVPNSNSLNITGKKITLSAWIKIKGSPGGDSAIRYQIVGKDSVAQQQYRLLLTNSRDRMELQIGGDNTLSDTFTALELNAWYYVLGTYDGKQVDYFVNGELVDSVSYSGSIVSDTDDVQIGKTFGNNYLFNGQIDEVRIYNRALSPSEVKKLYEWAPGPVAHWKFDELSGTTAYDSVASSSTAGGNDGIINGAAWSRGKYGGALSFDGDDDAVEVTANAKIGDMEPFTVSGWVYPRSVGGVAKSIVAKHEGGSTSNGAWIVSIDSDRSLVFSKGFDSMAMQAWSSNYLFPLNEWSYFSVTWNGGNDASDDVDIYLNGIEQVHSYDQDGSGTKLSELTRNIYIGNNQWDSADFDGLIDDVRIYNYARTQKQILEDMGGSLGKSLGKPVLHLSFDEGQGATAYDSSIHQNNGLLYPGTGGDNTSSSSMWTKDGKVGGAMEFDGVDDWVDAGSPDGLDSEDEITISLWMKKDSNTLGYLYYPLTRPYLYSSSIVRWRSNEVNVESKELEIGKWYHVVGTYKASSSKLYINGELAASASDGYGGGDEVRIGTDTSGGNHFDGKIDEVKIWNYALSAEEVKTEYNHSSSLFVEEQSSADNNGTTVTGASTAYCVPGDTAQCDAPVLELKFDELSGTTTYDTSGNGMDAVYYGNADTPTWARGKYGGAVKLDDTDDYVLLSDSDDVLDISQDFSIFVWVNYQDDGIVFSDFYREYDGEYDIYRGYRLEINSSGQPVFRIGSGYDGLEGISSSAIISANQWHYLGINYDWDTRQVDFYVDGQYIDSDTFSNQINYLYNNTVPLIGSYFYNDDWPPRREYYSLDNIEARIDEVRVFNYARTPAQIAWDYDGGKPIAHWRFDECSGGTIHDESGNGNHGQLYLGTTGTIATGTCASSSDSFWYNGRTGKYNGSGSFDGIDDYVNVGNKSMLEGMEQVTVSSWVKLSALGDDFYVTGSYGGSANARYYLNYNNTGPESGRNNIWEFQVFTNGNSTSEGIESSVQAEQGTWTHVTGVYNGSNLKLYINGTQDTNCVAIGTPSGPIDSEVGDILLGARASYDFGGEGQIDEVKIWNYALTEEQIRQEYNGGSIRFGQ